MEMLGKAKLVPLLLPGPLLLWLGIKKAHKGEWALSGAQPQYQEQDRRGQKMLQWQKKIQIMLGVELEEGEKQETLKSLIYVHGAPISQQQQGLWNVPICGNNRLVARVMICVELHQILSVALILW